MKASGANGRFKRAEMEDSTYTHGDDQVGLCFEKMKITTLSDVSAGCKNREIQNGPEKRV